MGIHTHRKEHGNSRQQKTPVVSQCRLSGHKEGRKQIKDSGTLQKVYTKDKVIHKFKKKMNQKFATILVNIPMVILRAI